MTDIERAKKTLQQGDCTLVLVNRGKVHRYRQRGVIDLLRLCQGSAQLLHGAVIADKIIGKGAAALMIMGKVSQVYTPKITSDAITMLERAGIACTYDTVVPMVQNRDGSGRCPIDTLCSALSDPAEMLMGISLFLSHIK